MNTSTKIIEQRAKDYAILQEIGQEYILNYYTLINKGSMSINILTHEKDFSPHPLLKIMADGKQQNGSTWYQMILK